MIRLTSCSTRLPSPSADVSGWLFVAARPEDFVDFARGLEDFAREPVDLARELADFARGLADEPRELAEDLL
jgi:hypothetical protein